MHLNMFFVCIFIHTTVSTCKNPSCILCHASLESDTQKMRQSDLLWREAQSVSTVCLNKLQQMWLNWHWTHVPHCGTCSMTVSQCVWAILVAEVKQEVMFFHTKMFHVESNRNFIFFVCLYVTADSATGAELVVEPGAVRTWSVS